MESSAHVPVLLDEVIAHLRPGPRELLVDLTLGHGGHAAALLAAAGPADDPGAAGPRLVGFDQDPAAIEVAARRIAEVASPASIELVHDSFVRAPAHLLDRDLRADVVLADLGFSSAQMDDPGRGMSFRADGPLDMRLDPDGPMTAADLLAELDEPELARLLRTTGEEPLARPIARKLVGARAMEPITTTRRLAELVREAYGGRAQRSRMDPATRTFMALRIAVNDELGALDRLLEQVETAARSVASGEPAWLRPAARIGIIGFHSLEDRRTKQAFRRIAATVGAEVRTPKPVTAGEVEIRANPRSRSAKLRVIRLPGGSGRIGERL